MNFQFFYDLHTNYLSFWIVNGVLPDTQLMCFSEFSVMETRQCICAGVLQPFPSLLRVMRMKGLSDFILQLSLSPGFLSLSLNYFDLFFHCQFLNTMLFSKLTRKLWNWKTDGSMFAQCLTVGISILAFQNEVCVLVAVALKTLFSTINTHWSEQSLYAMYAAWEVSL